MFSGMVLEPVVAQALEPVSKVRRPSVDRQVKRISSGGSSLLLSRSARRGLSCTLSRKLVSEKKPLFVVRSGENDSQPKEKISRPKKQDPFVAAGQRLQSLLSNTGGDGEEEMLEKMLEGMDSEFKVVLAVVSGSIVATASWVICWCCGNDLSGGASLSLQSLEACLVGLAAAAPLAILKTCLWSKPARNAFPALGDALEHDVKHYDAILANLNGPQIGVVLAAEVLPTLLVLLPAAQQGLTLSFSTYLDRLGAWGIHTPEFISPVLALGLTAAFAGVARVVETSGDREELAVVQTAMENSDRYYRVMATGVDSSAADAREAAAAFRSVALTWLDRQRIAGNFLGLMTAMEVIFLGCLWRVTGDLTAPCAAALVCGAVDFSFICAQIQEGKKRTG